MNWAWHQCNSCGLRLKKSECQRLDDPQAPFGPELLCPHCQGLMAAKYHPALLAVVILLAAIAGSLAGSFLARL